jgi:hypothetical protein
MQLMTPDEVVALVRAQVEKAKTAQAGTGGGGEFDVEAG